MAVNTIPDHSVGEGGSVSVDVSGYFSDADGDELSYMASSSNADVATASMDGSTVTIEGVGRGSAVITVTASDGSATAAQGFNVTVESAVTNQPPVAVGTIPGFRVQIGDTSNPIDVAGYFSDPDGDELTYEASSANESVATVAREGSEVTITGVSAGDALITVTASDPAGARVSQGFRVDVPAGPEEATVVISRLLDANRNQISDPTGIRGTIYAVLDVQSNDETWTEIGLTLERKGMAAPDTVKPLCRGTGGSSADVGAGPGLAAAGQVEIECALKTDDVRYLEYDDDGVGKCLGRQLDPKYANGKYRLSAYLEVAGDGPREDRTREVVASQEVALDNKGFVEIVHVPGSETELHPDRTKGRTFYGGPAVEGNVNSFHACPVAYDGTVVGAMQLGSMVTDTDQNPVAGPTVTFKTGQFDPDYPIVDEPPFTWSIRTDWWSKNVRREATNEVTHEGVENIPGSTETWIVNNGIITDPNGRDVSATFRDPFNRDGGGEAKEGPLHFDFKAPVRSNTSEVKFGGTAGSAASTRAVRTKDKFYRDWHGNRAMRLWISDMTDMGVGHVHGVTSAVAVGDCSVRGNADGTGSTAFTPLEGLEQVTHVNQLPEEDPNRDGVADGGGVDCYVAEVQALADRLGNAVELGRVPRIRTATDFGVDRTGPVISRERPSEPLVLNENSLFFEVEDPPIATGEDGSPLRDEAVVRAGATSGSNVYWTTTAPIVNGSVEIDIDPASGTDQWGNNYFAREIQHTVYAIALDSVGNNSGWTSFTFTRDHTAPTLSLSQVPSNFGATTASSVTVTVAGTLTDATEIRRAFLSIHAGNTCDANSAALPSSVASGPTRRLHNGTNQIEFSEVFTVKKGDAEGLTHYCFYLQSTDDARNANNGAMANPHNAMLSTFSVSWPGTGSPVAIGTIADASLQMGGTETAMIDASDYFNDPDGDDLTYGASSSDEMVATVATVGSMVRVTAAAAGNAVITVTASDGQKSASQTWNVTVAAEPPAPGLQFAFHEIVAADNSAGDVITELDVTEGAAATTYIVKVPQADTEAEVTITPAPGVDVSHRTLTFPNANTAIATDAERDTFHVTVATPHDLNNASEELAVTYSAMGFDDATLMVTSADDDFAITTDVGSINEDDAATDVTVRVTAGTAPTAETTVTVAIGYPGGDAETTPAPPTSVAVVIAAGMTSGEAEVKVDALDDNARDEANEMISFTVSDSDPAAVYYKPASIEIMDDDPDITLTLSQSSVSGATDGTVRLTITATADAPVNNIVNISLAVTGTAAAGATADYTIAETTPVVLMIDARGTTATATVTLTINGDADTADETIVFDDDDGIDVGGGKIYTVNRVTFTITGTGS